MPLLIRFITQAQMIAIAAFLGGLGSLIVSLDHWVDVLHPSFIGGFLLIVAAAIKLLYSRNPADGASPQKEN